jgi:hypothetical protein
MKRYCFLFTVLASLSPLGAGAGEKGTVVTLGPL